MLYTVSLARSCPSRRPAVGYREGVLWCDGSLKAELKLEETETCCRVSGPLARQMGCTGVEPRYRPKNGIPDGECQLAEILRPSITAGRAAGAFLEDEPRVQDVRRVFGQHASVGGRDGAEQAAPAAGERLGLSGQLLLRRRQADLSKCPLLVDQTARYAVLDQYREESSQNGFPSRALDAAGI